MSNKKNYKVEKLSFLRKAVRASASVTRQKNVIHFFSDVDVSVPLRLIDQYKKKENIRLSFTGYLAKCFGNTVMKYPRFNSFISGNRMVILDDLNISILVERKIGNELVPEPMVLNNVDKKSNAEITGEIRGAQAKIIESEDFGGLNQNRLFNIMPGFLLKTFVRLADRNIRMGIKYAKLSITSVGMFAKNPFWVIPHGSATVLLTVGSISEDKKLHLTVSFDHDIIDGAPAARFMDALLEEIKSGGSLPGGEEQNG